MVALRLALVSFLFAVVCGDLPIPAPDGEPVDYNVLLDDDQDQSGYRLDYDLVRPSIYTIEITPYFETTDTHTEFTFDGKVDITVNVIQDRLEEIILHALVTEIKSVTVFQNEVMVEGTDHVEDAAFHLLTIRLPTPADAGDTYVLSIVYTGEMSENYFNRGFYRGSYFVNGDRVFFATTHMQPWHARKVFPCFDEPRFKAIFNLIINRPAAFSPSFGNMDIASYDTIDGLVREEFYPTPEMSTYLLAIFVGTYEVAETSDVVGRPARIVTRPNAINQGAYALKMTVDLTEWMDAYFLFPYYSMGKNMKNDQLAIPDYASGATENWGMVNYREPYLLYQESENSISDKSFVATIISHELAHKWFGNLITCEWWDNIWINEAFASYFELFATMEVEPSLQIDKEYPIRYFQVALQNDQIPEAFPLNRPSVTTPAQIVAHFGTLTYAKGASVLRMIELAVGPTEFRDSLRKFLYDNKFSTATPEDIYAAFTAVTGNTFELAFPNSDVREFFQCWIDQTGIPILTVTTDLAGGSMQIHQERFFISGELSTDNQVWHIPLTFATSVTMEWDDFTPSRMLTEETTPNIQLGNTESEVFEWVILNKQRSAYYRVNYDANNWNAIAAALLSNPADIHYHNRAQIIDDVFALMRADRLSYEFGLDIIKFVRDDVDYNVWNRVINGYLWIRLRLLSHPEILQTFDQFLAGIMVKVIEDVGYDKGSDEESSRIRHRIQLMGFLCRIGQTECLESATTKFQNFKNNDVAVDPDERRHVYCYGLQEGDEEDYQFLWERFMEANNAGDEVVLIRAFTCTKHADSLRHLLIQSTTNPKIRLQDRASIVSNIALLNPTSAFTAFEYLRDNEASIRDRYMNSNYASLVNTIVGSLTEESHLQAVLTFSQANSILTDAENENLRKTLNTVRSTQEWGADQGAAIVTILTAQISSAATFTLSTSLLLAALLFIFQKV